MSNNNPTVPNRKDEKLVHIPPVRDLIPVGRNELPKIFDPSKIINPSKDISISSLTQQLPSTQAYLTKGINSVGASLMWNKNITGAGVIVGVIDTGIADHPDLKGKLVFNRVYTGETTPPLNPHGTHVAGTIAANGQIVGVAYGAKLGSYRALDNNGSGSLDSVVKAIRDAVADGCHVISMSLGTSYDYGPLADAVRFAYNAKVPVIAAAGNDGDNNNNTNEFDYPGAYPTVQCVGAVDYNGKGTVPAPFSASNNEVDCCSQGVYVLSTALGGNYMYMSGTSMATPHIAGVTALIIQKYRSQGVPYNTDQIYRELSSLCKDIYLPGRDNATGKGFVSFKSGY